MKERLRSIACTVPPEIARYKAEAIRLAKLCTKKYKGPRANKILLDVSDSTCPLCKQDPQDFQHWLHRCQTTEKLIFNLFGKDSGGLDCLTKHPVQAVALARRTFLRFLLAQGN